ncbi:uncharacterized protein B0P05DRAFT_523711 [Gilbertella persicaria]|uniref:uncharacterized protein n=1 Tax=Gilbertella persicaria TaxID=101096 RepID=UPI00221FF409|nr:uncharacterized protein B0P05DRAFT_523711 [Gilbertella persicaria]KAI8094858.1 hypothetical protein B0P05DRAFT_523711 [Gilbertella persicaria]
MFTPTSTYKYETLSWLTGSFFYSTESKTTATTTTTAPESQTTTHNNEHNNASKNLGQKTPGNSEVPTTTTNAVTTSSHTESASSTTDNTLPQYITANIDAIIPDTSKVTHIRFNSISYSALVDNALMAAQLVQELPTLFSNALSITPDDVIVLSITQSIENAQDDDAKRRKRAESDNSGIVVAVAVPQTEISELQSVISNSSSELYSEKNGQLPAFIDRGYNITNLAAAVNGGSGSTVADPNSETSSQNNSSSSGSDSNGGLSKGAIIGICVGIGACVYAAATVVGVKVYRSRKQKREQEAIEQHMVFADSISSPIMQGNSLGWVPAPYQQHQIPRSPLQY